MTAQHTSIPPDMTAVEIVRPGGPEVLIPTRRPTPRPGNGELLIRVHAAGVNGPDVLQRKGFYAPPPGASDLPGLEVAGEVVSAGPGANRFARGDMVCALLTGGGYADYAVADESVVMKLPAGLTLVEAAAMPETFMTVWQNLIQNGRFRAGESLLIHGGASGIGTVATMVAKAMGASQIITTVGS
ncbi:MAG: alcohol dehydrogenase catalytic domain-containing protein, partial [Telmatospirillum sp.]|nr:alcohol dehydrogenase catalytic domain-containing protein [Telmatospirillum sp.]